MKAQRNVAWVALIAGIALCIAPIFAAGGIGRGMAQISRVLGGSGIEDPQKVAEGVGAILLSTTTALSLALLGVIILPIGIVLLVVSRPLKPPPLPPEIR